MFHPKWTCSKLARSGPAKLLLSPLGQRYSSAKASRTPTRIGAVLCKDSARPLRQRGLAILLCTVPWLLTGLADAAPPESARLQWTKSTPTPEPRAGYAAGVLDDKLVIAGGTYWDGTPGNWTTKRFSASVHAFDAATESWERLPDAPTPIGYAAFTVVNNRLFVMGGYTGSGESRKIFTLGKKGDSHIWSVVGDLPEPRLFAQAVTVGSSIYLLGGTRQFEPYDEIGTCCTSKTATNSLMVMDTDQPEEGWRSLTPFPGGKRWLSPVATDRKFIWMFGGIHQEKKEDPTTRHTEVLRYSIGRGTWEKMHPLPEAIRDARPTNALHSDGKILIMSFAKKVWQLDLETLEYTQITPLPEEVMVDGFFWINDQIVGASGENKLESPRRRSQWTFIGRFVPE